MAIKVTVGVLVQPFGANALTHAKESADQPTTACVSLVQTST